MFNKFFAATSASRILSCRDTRHLASSGMVRVSTAMHERNASCVAICTSNVAISHQMHICRVHRNDNASCLGDELHAKGCLKRML
jgi:hypothetical protein